MLHATGMIRRVDDLGRVVIPKEIRRNLGIRVNCPLEIFVDKNSGDIILRKAQILGSALKELEDFKNHLDDICRSFVDDFDLKDQIDQHYREFYKLVETIESPTVIDDEDNTSVKE